MAGYSYFYNGGSYGMDPNYGFVGYRMSSGDMGPSTNPQNVLQIMEVTNALNQGFKQIEVGALSSDVMAGIPKQHFKEIERMNKLTGSKASLHAPIQDIEASGITQQGYNEINREIVERKLYDVIEKAHQLNPKGNTPVTIHCSNMGGKTQIKRDGEIKTGTLIVVDQGTGEARTLMKEEERYYPEDVLSKEGKRVTSPEEQIRISNQSKWIREIQTIAEHKKNADEVFRKEETMGQLANLIVRMNELKTNDLNKVGIMPQEEEMINQIRKSHMFLDNVQTTFGAIFNEAYKYANEYERKDLKEMVKELEKRRDELIKKNSLGKDQNSILNGVTDLEATSQYLDEAINLMSSLPARDKNGNLIIKKIGKTERQQPFAPQFYKPVEEFAMEKSAKTFANVAMHSYKKFGENAPIISIENIYPGLAYSSTEDLKKLVDESRKQFIERAKKEGINESEAKKIANKVIGVTWDVGHANMMKQHGFSDEDIINQAKIVSKDVKHLHLSDNFGYADSHLVMGMGNVQIKQHLEELEKAGVLGDIMKIHEIGGMANLKTAAFPYMLEAFGSPIAGTSAPYWNQGLWEQGNYFMGYGNMLPEKHFSMYGAGFSGLPTELGGQIGNTNSRFSGTPNA